MLNIRDEIMNSAVAKMAAQKEAIIRSAIDRALGRSDWEVSELLPRMTRSFDYGRETFLLDGKVLVEFHRPESHMRDYVLTFTETYRLLWWP